VRVLLATYKRLPAAQAGDFLEAVALATRSGRRPAGAGERLWMSWDMLREMRAGGMTVGGHTVSHQILSLVSREEQRREIAGCARRIEEELGAPMRAFSYPTGKPGSFNADTRACLAEVGVHSAFSYYGGFRPLDEWDDYDVPRSAVEQDMSFGEFRAEALAPWLRPG
jgi:peptidoglycan/xylan/chitin deacetylase (PgdA/CDA1 family)